MLYITDTLLVKNCNIFRQQPSTNSIPVYRVVQKTGHPVLFLG